MHIQILFNCAVVLNMLKLTYCGINDSSTQPEDALNTLPKITPEPQTTIDIVPEDNLEVGLSGGTPTEIKDFPFLASIQKSSIPRCVGSLISDRWVLTTAHCLIDLNRRSTYILDPLEFTVVAGRTVISSGKKEGQEMQAKMFVIHSRFSRPHLNYDVGLIETAVPFVLGVYTQTTNLYSMPPEVVTFFPSCTFISWNTGKHSFDDYEGPDLRPNSMRLETMELKLMSADLCQGLLNGLISIDNMCVYLEEDQCPGQSGSPLVCGQSLYGIFSWTAGCTNTTFPAVFVRVGKIYHWADNIRNGEVKHLKNSATQVKTNDMSVEKV